MGSFDRRPADWDDYADEAWAPAHVIFCNSKWMGRERHDHQDVAQVRSCYQAAQDVARGTEVWPCTWLLEGRYDDGSRFTFECGSPSRLTPEHGEGSYACESGHDHVPAEVRLEQGWDYAEDAEEAMRLRRNGVQAVAMNGGSI
jgi:hypothetical protein